MAAKKVLKFKISEEMVKQLSLTEIAVLASISKNRKDNVTEYNYVAYMASNLQISERTVKNAISALKEAGAFEKVEKVNVEGTTNFRNKYFFAPLEMGFIIVSDDIFTLGLNANEIGFLIKAKAMCLDNGLSILGNKEKIAAYIGISGGKCTRMLAELQAKGLINYEASKMTLTNELFLDNSPLAVKYREVTLRRERTRKMTMMMVDDQIASGTILGKKLKALLPKATHPYAAARALLFGSRKIRVRREEIIL